MRPLTVALPLPLLLLCAFGCSSPKDNALFADGDVTSAAAANAGGSNGAVAGTDSGSGAAGSAGNAGSGSSPDAGSSTGAVSGSGGAAAAGSGSGGTSGAGGAGGAAPATLIETCDMLDGAVTNEDNGHCYRINADLLTFAGARDACQAAAGHLVTVSDKAEDAFIRDQLNAAHWLGATDGRPDHMEGTGPYTWVDGEPWEYSNWESGQPNAVSTDCPDESGGANCYEHCAYQSTGAWNDRACWHTIASICEWEPVAK